MKNKTETADKFEEEMRNKVNDLDNKIKDHVEYIYFLESEVSRLDQYGRRENIEIMGLPAKVNNKDLERTVLQILKTIGLKHIQHYHIVACHRLGKKDKYGNRNVIIRFINRKDAILCLKNKKNLQNCKNIGFNNLHIVENLCPSYKSIFESLTEFKYEGKIKKVWSFNGVINYKLSDNDNEHPTKIYHEKELDHFYAADTP